MRLFKRSVKSIFGNTDSVIEWAFTVGGIDYYRFADINNLSYKRGLMAVSVYNELDMRCSREYLMLHTKAVEDILKSKEIDIYKINAINEQMKQRLKLTTDVDLMYRVASVAFFDKNESPDSYDATYSERKIEHWRQHAGVADFFLSLPLKGLIPYLQNVDVDLDTFGELNKELNEIHLALLRSMSSKKE